MSDLPESVAANDELAHRRKVNLSLAVVALITLTSCGSVFPVFGTQIREQFDLTAEQYGTMMALPSLGHIPATLLVGPAIILLGVRRITESSMVGVGLSFLLIGIGASLLPLKLGMLAGGFCSALTAVACPSFLIALFPTYKRRMMSIQLVAGAASAMIFPLLANQLLHWFKSGKLEFEMALFAPFLVIGTLLIVGGLLLALGKQTHAHTQLETPSKIRLRDLLSRRSLLIVLLLSLHGSADNVVYSFLPMFMEDHFKVLPIAPALALSGHGLAYVTTRSILSVLPEGLGQRAILTLAGPLGGTMVIIALWSESPIAVPIIYTVASLCFAAEFPTLVSEISSRSTAHFGSLFAVSLLVGDLATFGLLKFTGRLFDRTGDFRVALSFAACGFIAFGVIAAVSGIGKTESKPA